MSDLATQPLTKVSLAGDNGVIIETDLERKFERSVADGDLRDSLERLREALLHKIDALVLCEEEIDLHIHSLDNHGPAPSAGMVERLRSFIIDGYRDWIVPALKDVSMASEEARSLQRNRHVEAA